LTNVRFWHKADMLNALINVRFGGKNGHGAELAACPLLTHSGHLGARSSTADCSLLRRVQYGPKSDMAGAQVDFLWLPRRRAVTGAIIRGAKVRAAFAALTPSHHHTVTLLSNSVLLVMTTVSAPSPMV
jgi:hypothetical protein